MFEFKCESGATQKAPVFSRNAGQGKASMLANANPEKPSPVRPWPERERKIGCPH